VIFEVTACAAAVGGITVFRLQDGGTGRYASLAPVLCAVPVVIVTLRVYQALLRALARAATRRRGVIGFVGLARAAQAPVTNALPAMTLVLALIVAAFAGMVRVAALSTENAAAWRATGADVVVTAPGQLGLSPAAQRAIGAVPGVRHAAAAFTAPLTVGGGSRVVTAVVVDPASYAALTAVAPGYPPLRPGLLTTPPAAGVIPVLASSQAAAALSRTAASAIVAQQGLPSLRVRVAGELPATPALPGGTAFIVMSRSALGGSRAPLPNLLLLTGTAIDMPRLEGVVRALMPGAGAPAITTRQGALRELTGAPLQRGTFLLFAAASAFAVALALVAALLGLALGAAEREMTAARLATMGLTGGQRARLAALEVLPAIAATAAAGAACAFVLPRLLAPAVDLTGLTHAPGPAALRPDVTALALPLAALLVVTVITLACEANFGRRTSRAVR
jgi:putative ABC transport system permease protein